MSESVIHRLIDAAVGRQNISEHEADELHDTITPGYSAKPLSAAERSQLEALLAKHQEAEAKAAAAAAPAEEAPAAEEAAV